MECVLSRDEVHEFLTQTLCLDVTELLAYNGLETLNAIIVKFYEKIPYQNLYFLLEKRLPTFNEIKRKMFRKIGGLCFELNLFAVQLLMAIGYEAFIARGLGRDDIHMVIVVKNVLKPGDLYLVDFGFGNPMLKAIPLHDLKVGEDSPAYHIKFIDFKVTRKTEDTYALINIDDWHRSDKNVEFVEYEDVQTHPLYTEDYTIPEESTFTEEYSFVADKPVSFDVWKRVEGLYKTSKDIYYKFNFHCVRYKGMLAMAFKNQAFLRESSMDHKLKVEKMCENFSELKEMVLDHFPEFDAVVVDKALDALKANQERAPKWVARYDKKAEDEDEKANTSKVPNAKL